MQVTVSTAGGELRSSKTADGHEWLWQVDDTYWSDRSPHLFPYVGRLWQNRYRLEYKAYAMTIHGFIHQQNRQIENCKSNAVTMVFNDTPETQRCYPYAFRFSIQYQVIAGRLDIAYQVENQDARPMYFGIGGHPGFLFR